jgi:hypothetical protein
VKVVADDVIDDAVMPVVAEILAARDAAAEELHALKTVIRMQDQITFELLADLAAARQQLDQVRAILAVLRDFIHPDQGNAATPYGDGKRYVAVRDIEQVLRLDAPARPAGHDETGAVMDTVPRERYAALEQLAPGDRIWLDEAWREVVATAQHDGDVHVFVGTVLAGDVRDFTAPAALLVRRAER